MSLWFSGGLSLFTPDFLLVRHSSTYSMCSLKALASTFDDIVTCSGFIVLVKSKAVSKRSVFINVLLPQQFGPTIKVETYLVAKHSKTYE